MKSSPFSLSGLGYVGIGAPDPKAWRDFATEVCGLMPAKLLPGPRPGGVAIPAPDADGIAADGTAFLKLDDQQWRIAVHPAQEPCLRYLGFEVSASSDLALARDFLAQHGVSVEPGSEAEREARGVAGLLVLRDPAGHRIELFSGPIRDRDFRSPQGMEFVTGNLGMGHAVLYVPEIEPALAFYRDVLGFRRTDYMVFGPGGMSIHFLRCSRRHHSLALLQVGELTGLQHLMLETTSLDDVGRALDRAIRRGVSITSSLGRHRNDETVSFYMQGPSRFDIEIGWDSVLVDDDWIEHEFAGGGDTWGHHGLDAEALKPRK
jgi:3,4-dihydroxy-9,10-secoandrosta-1,3,5(10)-triene-9,17-dione 4,5-dioxygenase